MIILYTTIYTKKVLLAAKTSVSRQKLNIFKQKKIKFSFHRNIKKWLLLKNPPSSPFQVKARGGWKKAYISQHFLKTLSLYLSAHYIFRTNLLAARKFARGLLHTNDLWHLHHTFFPSSVYRKKKKTARKKENFHPSQFFPFIHFVSPSSFFLLSNVGGSFFSLHSKK